MRQRILEVSARLFAQKGYSQTSVRDIAKELGIANPSIYHHFKSKAEVLEELLSAPMRVVETALAEAQALQGEARARRIMEGFVDSLPLNSGVALAATANQRQLAYEMQPFLMELLGDFIAEDNRELRVMMAMGAVEGAYNGMRGGPEAVGEPSFSKQRNDIVRMVLNILSK
jgi:AcrR family transcriptional regulator